MRRLILRLYQAAIDAVVIGLVLLMLVTLAFAFFDVLMVLVRLIPTVKSTALDEHDFRNLVISVLDVFVIIELFGTFIDYVKVRRIRLFLLIDVTAVFILRELLITVYGKSFATRDVLVLALLLAILVVARTIAGRWPPKTMKEL